MNYQTTIRTRFGVKKILRKKRGVRAFFSKSVENEMGHSRLIIAREEKTKRIAENKVAMRS